MVSGGTQRRDLPCYQSEELKILNISVNVLSSHVLFLVQTLHFAYEPYYNYRHILLLVTVKIHG